MLGEELMRLQHLLGVEGFVEFVLGHELMLEHEVVDRASGLVGLLGNLRAALVADVRVQGGNDADGVLHHFVAALLVDGDAEHTLVGERGDSVAEPPKTFKEALRDDGLHNVELELTGLSGKGHGGVVADDLKAGLVGHLRNDGVDLSGHDAGTGSLWRKVELMQATTWTRSQQTQVVADLGDLHSQALQCSRVADVGSRVGRGLHKVG